MFETTRKSSQKENTHKLKIKRFLNRKLNFYAQFKILYHTTTFLSFLPYIDDNNKTVPQNFF